MAGELQFEVEAARETPRAEVALARKATRTLRELWTRLPSQEWQSLFEEVERTLNEPPATIAVGKVHPLTKEPAPAPEQRAKAHFLSLVDRFAARRQLLESSLTAPQVARLLGSSRQTPLTRAESASLLAVYDRGAWRFPAWQFDPEGPDGVIDGLPRVLRALDGLGAFAKLVWLTRPSPYLEDRSPIDALHSGEVGRVEHEARAVAQK